ncbi:MAG: DnrO protein [Dokdonella sp.]
MKPGYFAYLLLSTMLYVALPATAQHSHDEHESHAATTAPVAIPVQRHATDAALRDGMSRIQAALDELTHYEMGHMPQSIAVERVDTIKQATDTIFANCKLDPEADAALHSMLVPLLNGIQAFQKNPADSATVATMRQAVADYPRVFDDPDWPLEAGADSEHAH